MSEFNILVNELKNIVSEIEREHFGTVNSINRTLFSISAVINNPQFVSQNAQMQLSSHYSNINYGLINIPTKTMHHINTAKEIISKLSVYEITGEETTNDKVVKPEKDPLFQPIKGDTSIRYMRVRDLILYIKSGRVNETNLFLNLKHSSYLMSVENKCPEAFVYFNIFHNQASSDSYNIDQALIITNNILTSNTIGKLKEIGNMVVNCDIKLDDDKLIKDNKIAPIYFKDCYFIINTTTQIYDVVNNNKTYETGQTIPLIMFNANSKFNECINNNLNLKK